MKNSKQIIRGALVMATWLGLLVASSFALEPQPTQVMLVGGPPVNGTFYTTADGEILVGVRFDINVLVDTTGGSPYLRLYSIQPGNVDINRAFYFGTIGETVLFTLDILPGMFADPLNYVSRFTSLQPNGSIIYDANLGPGPGNEWQPASAWLPVVGGGMDLGADNLLIQTMRINVGVDPVTAGQTTASWTVGRGGATAAGLTVFLQSSAEDIATVPASVTIPAAASEVAFALQGVSPGTAWIIGRADGHPASASFSNQVTVVASTNDYLLVEPVTPPPYDEGTTPQFQVRRVGSLFGPLDVTLTSTAPLIANPLNGTVTIPNGANTAPFSVGAYDGNYNATIIASDPNLAYAAGQYVISVLNVDPVFTYASVAPNPVMVGATVTAAYGATDVPADIPKLIGTINWGDGSPVVLNVLPDDPRTHVYAAPGEYTVVFTVRDTDGGIAVEERTVVVTPGKTVTINIIQDGDIQGLANIGSGVVSLFPAPPLVLIDDPGVRLVAQYPESASTVALTATADQPGAPDYNSYVFQFIGDGLNENQQRQRGGAFAVVSESISLEGDVVVDVLFSREWMVGDARGDIDGDGLTDRWELEWGLDPMSPAGANGGGGSLTPEDRMPNAPNVLLVGNDYPNRAPYNGAPFGGPFGYPIPWTVNWTGYAPLGPIFNNLLHFRGQLIEWSDADAPNADPTVADTTGDGLNDGWLYYFYAQAINDPTFEGRAYNPATQTTSLPILNADIRIYFNPAFGGGLAGEDLDGDGLTVLEEYALGTNPIDWDTDGDGMPDGWEVFYGLDPLYRLDFDGNPDNDYMAAAGANIHFDVYLANGFDPRTGWARTVVGLDLVFGGVAPNTRPFTNLDEYLVMVWWRERTAGLDEIFPEDWPLYSTDPLSPDTNDTGIPDGWALYVGLQPFDTIEARIQAAVDSDGDGLPNWREFNCRGGELLYPDLPQFVLADPMWRNKIWPTDPNDPDTDRDQIADGAEAGIFAYQIEGVTDPYLPGVGGGLNPTRADTDGDGLPDFWEASYAGDVFINADGEVERNGMDGTFGDAFADYDGDALLNYQEYLVNAVYHFQYDKWIPGLGYGGYDPGDFFLPVEEGGFGRRSQPWDAGGAFLFMLAEPRPLAVTFASTDPRLADTDGDGMDDYYEMFHGLNPLWGAIDVVGKGAPPAIWDARIQPWLVGDPTADPDQDGIPNFEEGLFPNRPDPQNHHTDPSPYWFTDISYSESFVNLYYSHGTIPTYWTDPLFPPSYLYSFANNEGFDTDNDNLSDKREIIGTDGSGTTDPLNFLSPARRRALYFDGDAAARTKRGFRHGANAFRSWTVEMWIRPANVASGARQILIERPIDYAAGDPLPPTEAVRRNFRLGIEPDGSLFAEYDNFGSDLLTERARAAVGLIQNDIWYHVAGVFDGTAKSLSLYVNGELRSRTPTQNLPANGVIELGDSTFSVADAPIVVGAAERAPSGVVSGGNRYYNFSTFGPRAQPDLHSFYRGHIDELRIWDGARTVTQILDDMPRAFKKADVEAVAGFGTVYASFPALLYHYNFNTLPDPDFEPIVPAQFEALNGRPNDGSYPGIPWWRQANDRSRIYDNYHFVHWIQNTIAHLPLNNPLDAPVVSQFGVDEEGNRIEINAFPNSMNPYNYGYTHAQSFLTEVNPAFQGTYTAIFNPQVDRMYNNLLPLRNARADMSVPLWDELGPGTNRDAIDSNGDGIPDWWYLQHGFDPEGPSVAFDDPDEDGLINYYEYLIGSDPNNARSIDGVLSDFDALNPVTGLTYGEMYAAWDGIPGWWKVLYPGPAPGTGNPGLSLERYDAQLDPDEDGWSNLAEFLDSYSRHGTNLEREPSPLIGTEMPLPALFVRLRYSGEAGVKIENLIREDQPVFLEFYRTPERDGLPSGRLTMTTSTVLADVLDEGWLLEGPNYVFAFMDTNGDGEWNTDWTDNRSEPAGVGVVDVGWSGQAELDIELTREPKGYWRFGWEPVEGAVGYTVVVREGDTELFRRQIHVADREDPNQSGDRNYFHEGDFMAAGFYGLRQGLHSVLIYYKRDFFGTEPDFYHTVVYRTFNDVVGSEAPVITTPQGISFRDARNFVEWRMDTNAVQYEIEVAADVGGSVGAILRSHVAPRPNKSGDGLYQAALPLYAGDTGNVGQIWANGKYWYRIRGVSRSGNTPYSAWRVFHLNVTPPEDGGKSAIEGTLYYQGRVRRGNNQNPRYLAGETDLVMIVQAFLNPAFVGEPVGQVQVNVPPSADLNRPVGVTATYELAGLPSGQYYIRAFIDLNGNRAIDYFEPWGMRRTGGLGRGYVPGAVNLITATGRRELGVDLVIRDHDSDNDGLADGWEYSYFGTLDYGGDYSVTQGATTATLLEWYRSPPVAALLSPMADAYSLSEKMSDAEILHLLLHDPDRDSDGDGMSDLHEVLFALTDPYDSKDVLRLFTQQNVGATGDFGTASTSLARIVWEGRTGVQYYVRSSANLKEWELRAVMDGAGEHVFEETDPSRQRQFYIIEVR